MQWIYIDEKATEQNTAQTLDSTSYINTAPWEQATGISSMMGYCSFLFACHCTVCDFFPNINGACQWAPLQSDLYNNEGNNYCLSPLRKICWYLLTSGPSKSDSYFKGMCSVIIQSSGLVLEIIPKHPLLVVPNWSLLLFRRRCTGDQEIRQGCNHPGPMENWGQLLRPPSDNHGCLRNFSVDPHNFTLDGQIN